MKINSLYDWMQERQRFPDHVINKVLREGSTDLAHLPPTMENGSRLYKRQLALWLILPQMIGGAPGDLMNV